MCLAGPGSGKTTVLTERVRSLIEENGTEPSHILIITFTRAAAAEMQNRFHNLCHTKLPVTFGTFHAVFFSILKAAYNYSVNNIIKEEDRYRIIRHAVEKFRQDEGDVNDMMRLVSEEISRVKSERIDIKSYYAVNCPEEIFRNIYNFYENELKKSRLLDFDDMLLYCHELLVKRPDILKKWQNRYRYILIDEFQDINRIQYEIVKMLAAPHNNLFIVGDDDQSIYGFRGSRPDIMLNFEKDYPETEKIYLDVNYRSSGNIVEASSRVISNNKKRFIKNLKTHNPAGEKIDIVEFNDIQDEYRRITETILSGVREGRKYSDFAVLFRTNAITAPIVRKLTENNIPVILKDGVPNIFEHWIAGDFLAYMRLSEGNMKRSDFIRIMNKPLRYIGRDYVTDSQVSFQELEKLYEDKEWMIKRLDKMQADLNIMSSMVPYAMINYIRKGIGYDDYLKEYADSRNLNYKELEDIADEITETAVKCRNLTEWIEYMDEYGNYLKEAAKKKNITADAVTMTTMHSAKGLEYDTVFIMDSNEEITPHKKAVFDEDIEEERRMFYVAMTRAKRKLYIMYSKKRYNKELEASRFVKEIIEENK